MTLQEMIAELPTLTIEERKALVSAVLDSLTQPPEPQPKPRTPGLHAGTTWVSDDFDDPLPDSFWLGEDA